MRVVSRRCRQSARPSSPGIMMSSTTRSTAPALSARPRGGGVFRHRHAQLVALKVARQRLADLAVVVDHQNVRGGVHGRERTCLPAGRTKSL